MIWGGILKEGNARWRGFGIRLWIGEGEGWRSRSIDGGDADGGGGLES